MVGVVMGGDDGGGGSGGGGCVGFVYCEGVC